MDIYTYLNSLDVAEHCRKLNYQFTAHEAAFIISDCRRITVEEKHRLYREIMAAMPDMEVQNARHLMSFGYWERNANLSLFYHLEQLIQAEQRILGRLRNGKEGWFYSFYVADNDSGFVSENQGFYSTFDKMIAGIRDYLSRRKMPDATVEIVQCTLDSENTVSARLNADLEISFLLPGNFHDEDYENFLYETWVYIPTPFRAGDLVSGVGESFVHPVRKSNEPMVLREICYWERSEEWIAKKKHTFDSSDMTAYGWWLDRNGYLYDECIHVYHNLTYYRGEIEPLREDGSIIGDYRLLKAVSAYLKGEININMLLIANDAIRAERLWRDAFPGWDYLASEYEKAGISDIREKRDLLRKYEIERAKKHTAEKEDISNDPEENSD